MRWIIVPLMLVVAQTKALFVGTHLPVVADDLVVLALFEVANVLAVVVLEAVLGSEVDGVTVVDVAFGVPDVDVVVDVIVDVVVVGVLVVVVVVVVG